MNKMNMRSPNLTDENIAKLQQLFPGCVTEAQDEDGKIKLAIDFDQLKHELGDHIVEGPQERYQLNWPGKREALLKANAPIAKTLRPCGEESVDFDTTKNLFIEGDNLEALKLLQKTYSGKVKMIYLDPPYNTGKDFIYKDNFSMSTADYCCKTGQRDKKGNKLVANLETNGRFHSDWLSMMYPRLKLARNLLKDDGVIFISIDDHEQANLKRMCDEIFGASNFVTQFVWRTKTAPKGVPPINKVISNHEYIICYKKNNEFSFKGVKREKQKFSNPDNDLRGIWKSDNMKSTLSNTKEFTIIDPVTGNRFKNRWAFSMATIQRMIKEGRIIFPNSSSKTPRQKKFFYEYKDTNIPITSYLSTYHTETSTNQLKSMFDNKKTIDFPKSVDLLRILIDQSTNKDDIILDFFAGSSTTAHAVMDINAEDGGKRKFIMVQLAEKCGEKTDAFKEGYKTIAEISKERIRRAGNKILRGEHHKDWNKDIGFRVLKIDTSNMADVYYSPNKIKQDMFSEQVDNIKEGREHPEDLLFQVLLDRGVDLTLPIHQKTIQDKEVLFVNGNALIACFDLGITKALVKELAGFQPSHVVFRDKGFISDAVKINVKQIFEQLSSSPEVKTI